MRIAFSEWGFWDFFCFAPLFEISSNFLPLRDEEKDIINIMGNYIFFLKYL